MSDAPARPKLELEHIRQIEDAYNQVHAMPASPQREQMLKDMQQAAQLTLQHYDLPAEPISLEAPAVAALDYIPGMVRTAAGESALALAGKNTMAGAGQRIADAVVPDFIPGMGHLIPQAGRPAPSTGEYRKMLGYGNEQSPGLAAPLLSSFPDGPTRGGALDFASTMMLDPNVIRGAKNMLTKRAGAVVAPTLEEARNSLDQELQKRYAQSGLQKAAETGKDFLMDPAGTTGEALYNLRFRNADRAAKDLNLKAARAGKPMQYKPTSQIMGENGHPGWTSEGTQSAVDDIIANREHSIDSIETPNPVRPMPTRPQSQVLEPLFSGDVERSINTPGLTDAYNGARNDILEEFRQTMRQNPAQVAQHEEALARAGKPAFGPNGESLYTEPPTFQEIPVQPPVRRTHSLESQVSQETRPGVRVDFEPNQVPSVPPGWVVHEAPDGTRWALDPTRKNPQPIKLSPTQGRFVRPQDRTFESTQTQVNSREAPAFPERNLRLPNETMATNPHVSPDILDYTDPAFDPSQLRDIGRAYQQKARASGAYSQPSKFDVVTAAGRKATEENGALGALQNQVGGRARDLELQALEEMQPGLGAQVFSNYKDVSGLMQGSPFLDRPFNPGRNNAFKRPPFRNNLWNAALEAGKALGQDAASLAGKGLMSGPAKTVLLPAARAGMVEDYNEWRRNNPWETVRKAARGVE